MKVLNNIKNIDWNWISESRSTLMGMAIINVMFLHSCAWAHITLSSLPLRLVHFVCSIVFTGAFMFLSGYGIYFSLSKGENVKSFYKKRIKRVVIPFLIMATPFYLFRFVSGELSFSNFLLCETTIYNFVVSNNGMWYIAASILMYFLAPYLFKIMGCEIKKAFCVSILCMLFFITVAISIHLFSPDYAFRTSILWDKLGVFIIGMLFGLLSIRYNNGGGQIFISLLVLFSIGTIIKIKYSFVQSYTSQIVEILAIICYSSFFHCAKHNRLVEYIKIFFSWFGKYSLELYVIHILLIGLIKTIVYDNMGLPCDIYHDRILTAIVISTSVALCVPIHNITTKISLKLLK